MELAQFSINGKVAIITGASGGLGEALVYSFAAAGAKVVAASRNIEKLKEIASEIGSKGQHCIAVKTDVANSQDIQRLVGKTKATYNTIDILVSNAGVGWFKNLIDTAEEEWNYVMGVNLNAFYLLCRAAVPEMISKGKGKIINISSAFGFLGVSKMTPYCASKGALVNLTRALAVELARHNINVNGIAPGLFISPLNADMFRRDKELYEANVSRIPMRRPAELEELTATAIFLASDASNYITGQTILVDGGLSVMGNVR